jgi:glycerol-3-phosphate acyltransferase PlsY
VVIGHNWPVFFRFRGGGGLSVTLGVSVVLVPLECAIAFAAAVIIGFTYRYTLGKRFRLSPMPIGGGIGTLLLPILAFAFGKSLPIVLLFVVLFLIAVIKGIILTKIYK